MHSTQREREMVAGVPEHSLTPRYRSLAHPRSGLARAHLASASKLSSVCAKQFSLARRPRHAPVMHRGSSCISQMNQKLHKGPDAALAFQYPSTERWYLPHPDWVVCALRALRELACTARLSLMRCVSSIFRHSRPISFWPRNGRSDSPALACAACDGAGTVDSAICSLRHPCCSRLSV